mmetsp:Transcript_31781/g.48790  ORF Transcript_31781/g.48790 Transcript_31781/m.48790 type:complete len:100 (+) Transcript_31781:1005-1304(+)
MLVEKFLRVQQIAHGAKRMSKKFQNVKMIIMTNHDNYRETRSFFQKNKFFGGKKDNFLFHTQGVLPRVDLDGKIIMKKTSEIQLSTSGSGALFESISSN